MGNILAVTKQPDEAKVRSKPRKASLGRRGTLSWPMDRNEISLTVHGFDEFLGKPYHLSVEEDPAAR